MKICNKCNIEKNLDCFEKRHNYCKDCKKIQLKNYYNKNKIQLLQNKKKYYIENKDKKIIYQYNYKKNRLKKDIYFKLSEKIRDRFNKALKGNYKKGSAVRDLGCSIEEFKTYLESKFQPGMSWDNYGQWHLDHIKPLSSFNLLNQDELKIVLHYTNYQPLWAKDNLSKGAKYDPSS